MVERVVVTLQGESEKVDVVVHWMGGHQSPATMIRPVARLEQLSYVDALRVRVAQLHQQGLDRPTMAATLNAEGWRPAKRRQTFTADMVGSLLLRQGLGSGQAATGHQGGASGQRMDPDRVDADFRIPRRPCINGFARGYEGTASAPRVSPCVVDLGRRERT